MTTAGPDISPSFRAFQRSSVVTVGPVQISNVGSERDLDVEFDIRSSLRPKEPNTCDLRIYNLAESTRKAIEQASQPTTSITSAPGTPLKVVPVRIDAGYVGHTSTIFLGELRSAQTVTDGPDLVTELSTGDGDDALLLQRISRALPGGTSATQAIQTLLKAMGCGLGNLQSQTVQNALSGSRAFARGAALKGNPADHVVDLCRGCGLEFSVQGGQALFLAPGQPLAGQAYELSPGTGLVGSPTTDTKGVLSAVSLIFPGLRVGGPIVLNASGAQGLYRIVSIHYTGATSGQDWYARIEAKRYGLAP